MGVIYVVVPLEEEFCEYLDEMEVEYPEVDSPSKNPIPSDLLDVFKRYESLNVKSGFMNGSWQASIENKANDHWTTIHMQDCNELTTLGSIVFEKGNPELIVLVLRELSESLGPLGLVPDTGDEPLVVTPKTDIEQTLRTWEHTSEIEDEF